MTSKDRHGDSSIYLLSFRRSVATEESNAKLCPERSEKSTQHEKILRIAQDDLFLQVRFLAYLEMTERSRSLVTDTLY